MQSCEHFDVDSEIKNARYNFLNHAKETPNAKTVHEKNDGVFGQLNYAAKTNVVFF